MSPRLVSGVRRIADDYDLFIIDLWGTLHNGIRAYPGAIEALVKLRARGKTIAFLSNAPRRAASALRMLESIGVTDDLYDAILTSGEAVHVALRDRPDAWHQKLAGACWHLGPVRDRSIFDGLGLDVRETPDGCGFCVATGTRMNEERVEDYQDELDRALASGLPMICANPDIWVPVGSQLVICAGAFAEYYLGKGGDVFWHGKPHAAIYRQLFAALPPGLAQTIDPARMIAIGDGLPTDIAGAATIGMASALVTAGIHRLELDLNWRGTPRKKPLAALIDGAPAAPDFILRRFAW